MKGERKHSNARRLAIVGLVLVLLLVGLVIFQGGSNPKPTITVSLLSEVDLRTNRVATLVLSNSGAGSIALDVGRTNFVAGLLEAYSAAGPIDTTESHMSIIHPVKVLKAGDAIQFVERIPAIAKKWRFHTDVRDPSRLDQMWARDQRTTSFIFRAIDYLRLPEVFEDWVRGESEWTLDIQSPWFGPGSVSNGTD